MDFWSGTVQVNAKYRNMKKVGIRVCQNCALGWWRWKHGLSSAAWGVPLLAILIGAASVPAFNPKPSDLIPIYSILALFGIMIGFVWALETWELLFPSLKVASMEYLVLERVKGSFASEGDSFFTNTDYRVTFRGESPP
jgi:hypothetical protein